MNDEAIAQQPTETRVEHDGPRTDTVMTPAAALERLQAGKPIENVRIERLVFDGEFAEAVCLRNVTLVRPVFKRPIFRKLVTFAACTIDRLEVGRSAEFAEGWTLSGSTLHKCTLRNLVVHGEVKASGIRVRGKLRIADSKFAGKIGLWDATFECWLEAAKCEFLDEFDFRSGHCEQGCVFKQCRFAGDAIFRGTAFAKKWEATETRFEGLVDFSKAKLNDYIYLENIEQGPLQTFAFNNAVGDRVLVRPEQLEGRLASEKSGDYRQAMHEYAFLKRAYSSLHRYDEEDWAFYRFKVNQRRGKQRSWYRPWTKLAQFSDWILLDHGCGYCTNPGRAVRTALIILIGFAAIYMMGIEKFHIDKVPLEGFEKTSWPNRIVFSLVTSVAVFTSGLSGIKDIAKDWMNIPLVIEALLGTLLWGLFIVAFSRKVIR